MRHCVTIALILLATSIDAQKLDSVKFGNGSLFYHEYGKGKTIILLTGGPGNDCMQLSEMAIKLSTSNRIILFEQRGTGRSIPAPFDSTLLIWRLQFQT